METEVVTQFTTHYCSDYDQRSTTQHIVRRGTDSLGRRVTLCGTVIETSENSFRGPLSCIGSDSTWSAIETESLWSIYCDYSRSHGNCSDCFQYAIRLALRETAYPEQDAESVEA